MSPVGARRRPRCLACLLGLLLGGRSRSPKVTPIKHEVAFDRDEECFSKKRRASVTTATQTDETTVGGGGGRRLSVAVPVPWADDPPLTSMSFKRSKTSSSRWRIASL